MSAMHRALLGLKSSLHPGQKASVALGLHSAPFPLPCFTSLLCHMRLKLVFTAFCHPEIIFCLFERSSEQLNLDYLEEDHVCC